MQALTLATVLGTGLAGVLIVGAEPALTLMGAGVDTGEMHDLAKDFLIIRYVFCMYSVVYAVVFGMFVVF